MEDREELIILLESLLDEIDERNLYGPSLYSSRTTPVAKLVHPSIAPYVVGDVDWSSNGIWQRRGTMNRESIRRDRWKSSLFSCLGNRDEFCSSHLEVCALGSVAPCVLHASNVERMSSTPTSFTSHCLPYSCLYLIGNSLLGGNFIAPWFSYSYRGSIRRKFNLEGNCEAVLRSCGCCGNLLKNEDLIEQCEGVCDFGTHVCCHACALCQEGREVRSRIPHPGFSSQPLLLKIPPKVQNMVG